MSNGKTIKQIADEIGVSKQAIHQKRRKEPLSTALQPFTSTIDGVVYISVDGENLIKSAFSENDRQSVVDNEPTSVDTDVDSEICSILKETIDILHLQLEVKDNQIQELMNTIKIQGEIIKAQNSNKIEEKLIDKQLKEEEQKEETKFSLFGKRSFQTEVADDE